VWTRLYEAKPHGTRRVLEKLSFASRRAGYGEPDAIGQSTNLVTSSLALPYGKNTKLLKATFTHTPLSSVPGREEPGVLQPGVVTGKASDRTVNAVVDFQQRVFALDTRRKVIDLFPSGNLGIQISTGIFRAWDWRKHVPDGLRCQGGSATRYPDNQYPWRQAM